MLLGGGVVLGEGSTVAGTQHLSGWPLARGCLARATTVHAIPACIWTSHCFEMPLDVEVEEKGYPVFGILGIFCCKQVAMRLNSANDLFCVWHQVPTTGSTRFITTWYSLCSRYQIVNCMKQQHSLLNQSCDKSCCASSWHVHMSIQCSAHATKHDCCHCLR